MYKQLRLLTEQEEGYGIINNLLVCVECYKQTPTPKTTITARQIIDLLKEEAYSYEYAHHIKIKELIDNFEPLLPKITDVIWTEVKKEPIIN